MSDNDNEDDAFAAGEAIARNFFEDYEAIERVHALLFMLKLDFPKLGLIKVGEKYVIREVGWFRSKPVPGFTVGRMVEVEKQLRQAGEAIVGPMTDETINKAVHFIRMAPLYKS